MNDEEIKSHNAAVFQQIEKKHTVVAEQAYADNRHWRDKTGGDYQDMTLRDWFAGMAMQGLVSIRNPKWIQTEQLVVVAQSFEIADAMIKAREME